MFQKMKIHKLILFLLLLALIVGSIIYYHNKKSDVASTSATNTNSNDNNQKKTIIKLIATGDMIPHDAINQEAKQPDGSYKYSPMFGSMKQIFSKSDIRFCNQATLAGGKEFGISGYPKFNAPLEFTHDMADLGCNLINTGSNHVNDFGQDVIDSSIKEWEKVPNILAVAGANSSIDQMNKVSYFEVDGVKFAFVSYSTYTNEPSPNGFSVTMYNDELAKTQLGEARTKADIVIASMRWGTEYSSDVNQSQKVIAQNVVNYGADLILGHGPHVLQTVDRIKTDDGREATIWYSLGNFLNAQLDPPSLFNCIAVININIDSKKISSNECIPIYMHYEWTKAQKESDDLMARHNFRIYTFDDAKEVMGKSQNNTTLEAQEQRIKQILNKSINVKIINKNQFFGS